MEAIKESVRQEWELGLLSKEPRAQDQATLDLLAAGCIPLVASSRNVFDLGEQCLALNETAAWADMQAALACSPDVRRWDSLNVQRGKLDFSLVDVACACGDARPSRRHLAWNCGHFGGRRGLRPPRGDLEEGLLIPLVRPALPAPPRCSEAHEELKRVFDDIAARRPGSRVRAAFDGGSRHKGEACLKANWTLATWGVAVKCEDEPLRSFGGRVGGVDQSSHASERSACVTLMRAAEGCDIDLLCLGDNISVLTKAREACAGGELPREGAGDFLAIANCGRGGFSRLFEWVPAHSRHEDWRIQRSEERGNEDLWRELNEHADREATAAAVAAEDQPLAALRYAEWTRALSWAQGSLSALAEAAVRYCTVMTSRCCGLSGPAPREVAALAARNA
jgi:hypothetical protein